MRRARYGLPILLALAFSATSLPGARSPRVANAGPLVRVHAGRVAVTIPSDWDVRALRVPGSPTLGIQAAGNLSRWSRSKLQHEGLEAFWVDSTAVGVPSDYYYLLARSRANERFAVPGRSSCQRTDRRVLANNRPLLGRHLESPGDYVVTASGTCVTGARATRWVSFAAAPGFGPVKRLGIPESGYYSVLVVVPEGPAAERRIERLIAGVAFDGTTVPAMMRAASRRASV